MSGAARQIVLSEIDPIGEKLKEFRRLALTPKQELYANYRVHLKPPHAYRAAYEIGEETLEHTLRINAYKLDKDPNVQARIRELRDAAASPFVLERGRIIRKMLNVAFADVSELFEYRRGACRHCHGVGALYQWRDETEYSEAVDAAINSGKSKLPECLGGFGYRSGLPLNEDCARCDGNGVECVVIADTRYVTGPARDLIKGFKMTRNGPELVLHDQIDAAKQLAEMLGLTRNDLTLIIGDPRDLPEVNTDGRTLAELAESYRMLTA